MAKSTGNTGWNDTNDSRVSVLWEDGLPVRVSVTLEENTTMDDGWLEGHLDQACANCLDHREHVCLVGNAGHWEQGEGEGEMVRRLEIKVDE